MGRIPIQSIADALTSDPNIMLEERAAAPPGWANDYINPDILPRSKSTPFIYGNNKMYYGQVGQVHGDILDKIFDDDNKIFWDGAQSRYLLGRAGIYQGNYEPMVSFWNESKRLYDMYLNNCLQQLMHDKVITDATMLSTPIHGLVPVSQVLSSQAATKELTPEESEKLELHRQLHLAPSDQKRAIMQKLGLSTGSEPHQMQTALRDAGLQKPGQKWWAPTSESNDILSVAAMLTDDPDILIENTVNEWGWGRQPQNLTPTQSKLATLTKVTDPNILKNWEQEFIAFARYQPTLMQQGEQKALEAFVAYKKSGRMPNERDSSNLDQMTHADRGFRP